MPCLVGEYDSPSEHMMALINPEAAAAPAASALDRRDWLLVGAEEYRRLSEALRELSPEQWHAPTDCDDWDVYAMVCHLVGAAEANANMGEALRQRRLGKKLWPDADPIDAINAVQIQERQVEAPRQLLTRLADAGQRSVRSTRQVAWPSRALRAVLRRPSGLASGTAGRAHNWIRDAWMHRIDVCRATGQSAYLTADHDARIVNDIVGEWARTHGQPYELRLTGPAGGEWSEGSGGSTLELDAVEFCRILSGRGEGSGLLATRVAF